MPLSSHDKVSRQSCHYWWINDALCQADDPWNSAGRRKEVRWVQARRYNNADEEVLFGPWGRVETQESRVRISKFKDGTYRYEFVQENQANRVRGVRVQCEDTSGPKAREVYDLVFARGDERRLCFLRERISKPPGTSRCQTCQTPADLNECLPLPIHKQTGGEATENLRNDVSS